MEIRQFRESDRADVIALWNDVFAYPAAHNDPASAIDRKLAIDPELFFVAVVDSTVAGTVMGGYDGHRGWVYSLAVASNRRRQNMGSALMKHLEMQLSRLGCPKVNLQVYAENREVVAFYEELGYHVEERVSMGKLL